VFQNCFNEKKRTCIVEKFKKLEYVHKIDVIKEGEQYAIMGKGSVLYCLLTIGEKLQYEYIHVKGIDLETHGDEFSITTANILTVDQDKKIRAVVSENDLLHFNESTQMVTK
jgi:transketolase C-terminal domain/subunit